MLVAHRGNPPDGAGAAAGGSHPDQDVDAGGPPWEAAGGPHPNQDVDALAPPWEASAAESPSVPVASRGGSTQGRRPGGRTSGSGPAPYDDIPPPDEPLPDDEPPLPEHLPPDDAARARLGQRPTAPAPRPESTRPRSTRAASSPRPGATRPSVGRSGEGSGTSSGRPPSAVASAARTQPAVAPKDDEVSADDDDLEGSHLVGPSVVEQLLGGRVIEERED
jgi:DNA polymerase-3 subunit gamma/tau